MGAHWHQGYLTFQIKPKTKEGSSRCYFRIGGRGPLCVECILRCKSDSSGSASYASQVVSHLNLTFVANLFQGLWLRCTDVELGRKSRSSFLWHLHRIETWWFAQISSSTCSALHGYFESLRTEKMGTGLSVCMLCPGPTFSRFCSSHSWFPIGIFQFTGGGRHRNPWSEFWRINEIHGQKDDRWEVRYEAVFAQNYLWRCAELSLVSIVNKLPESWICSRPVLPLMYASQYLPGISKWVSLSFFNKYSSVLILNLPCCAARVVMSVLGPAFLARVRDSRNAMESEKLK